MAFKFAAASTQYLSGSAPVTAAPFTISAWFKLDTRFANRAIVTLSQNSGTQRWILYATAGNNTAFFVNDAGGFTQPQVIQTLNTGIWYNAVAVEASATDHRLFLNGGSKNTTSDNRAPASVIGLNIGNDRYSNTNNNPMDGSIADVAIWNTALTDAEVASIAKGFSATKMQPGNLVFYAPLVRDLIDYSGSLALTNNNSATVSDHPRIYV